ncbi:sialate O-acetylesterase [Blastopirellula sp. J2-11]|uniref:sialate O-acetylesterase n=1 Tax=Blastopirellula sp. J2-11 TaxID=2943192 RepID=UPI0021C8AABB|nr:sialate O-acetylesterase [Blastopirellula sp. J2-11]UUO04515.1 sialate O-acetylesterase [Blastopirellula sp. J2-11]
MNFQHSNNIWRITLATTVGMLVHLMGNSHCLADIRLPAVFSNHMVLQKGKTIPVWGWSDPQEWVTVSILDSTGRVTRRQKALTESTGVWSVQLNKLSAGGPYVLRCQGTNTKEFQDVWIGEVWIAVGQSNMEFPVKFVNNADSEIASADIPQIRLFQVAPKISATPQTDCGGSWSVCTPDTVADFSAVAYFFGRRLHKELHIPIGLIIASWGGSDCEAWIRRQALHDKEEFAPILERSAVFQPNSPNQAAVLYNAMIYPLIPYPIAGVIWYQGEANTTRAAQYHQLFPTLITDWREQWGQRDFPFLFVQLAPFRYGPRDPEACAELREAQRLTLQLPNTGMAVTTDIGDIRDIHPRNKQDVGQRLALWALAQAYGKKEIVHSGPLYAGYTVEEDSIRIRFSHIGSGLVARNDESLTHFTIAASDKKFVEAKATIEGDTVVVRSTQVANPVAARFAWRDDATPNLFNLEGLPASPFRTDRFPMVTAGER